MTLGQLDFDGNNKIEASIALIQTWQPVNDPYYLAFSGGKDSVVLKALTDLAGAKYQSYYHPSPLDPAEQVKFVREFHPDTIFEKPVVNFWKAFDKKGFPLRQKRWCCEYIKEWGGAGRTCLFGVRSNESKGRSRRCFVESQPQKTRFGKAPLAVINPILKWTEADVWQFIRENHLPYCSLYDEGFKRLGCIMCPLASREQRLVEYRRFPRTALAWTHGFARLYAAAPEKYNDRWQNADDMFWWWMGYAKAPEGTVYPPVVGLANKKKGNEYGNQSTIRASF
jgi:phosphoadenosine phosphosulfate reductase